MKIKRKIIARARTWRRGAYDPRHSHKDGFFALGRNAMAKSFEEQGDEGVMITAGGGDFSVTLGSVSMERSG